jgi:hypothetical protein
MDQAAGGRPGDGAPDEAGGGAAKSGTVEKVDVVDGQPLLVVGSDRVDPARLTEVR